ncbi:beta-ketoacyl-ACP synthase II [Roseimaritima ulvae]|uniref:3-oxoacyl-[acyl-carrier-protein] synthase 2 n=1 Tax=Roseimaritima ulvae TaxID=980254 RepID=A0A5B9QWU8_9BACT|nr:beta-ketoacyl-ACP synthase II [Roseimaritima ulvae]QEG43524.1 3-oxoacyl-[acyl-carrier-protein] synthase 2 [Roseimaritima ulvae]
MKRRVVITGTGLVTPLGSDVQQVWQRLLDGESGIHLLSMLDTDGFKIRIGGDIPDFDLAGVVESKEAKRLDRFSQFALLAANQAVAQSGLDFSQEDATRCGSILGSGIGGLWEIEAQMERMLFKGTDRVSPFTVPKMMLNAASGNLGIHFGLRGANHTVATACASATNAMGDALFNIQRGDTEMILTGGSEAAITRIGLAGFQNMKALSSRNDDPQAASRPFDAERDGFVLSEGAGISVFEELEHAKARGAEIIAEVIGFGCSCDAGHITQPDPQGSGAAQAMRMAIANAGLQPADVDYINAHGTSTPLGDKAETNAIRAVFGEHAQQLAISSTKASLGHSLGASGGIEAVVAAMSLKHGMVHPTINLTNPDPDCDLDYTPNEAKQRPIKVAMSNSFGFGGHNACLVLKRFDD